MWTFKVKPWQILGTALLLSVISDNAVSGDEPAVTRHTLKELRDYHIVKQQLDYSCGAAALATLLRYYYGEDISEQDILAQLGRLLETLTDEEWAHKTRIGFSLLDLKKVALERGYRAAGFELPIDKLPLLTAPVLVYVHPFDYHHFAILRGIAGDRVYLADPTRGNLRMSLSRFADEYGGVIFVLGKPGEEEITRYPLALGRDSDYPEARQADLARLIDRRASASADLYMRTPVR